MTESTLPIKREEIIEILRVGLKAVSPYNAQPWEFQLKDGHLLIYTRHNDRGFWKFKDVIFFSLGAFLENLSEGAKHWHYTMTYTHVNDTQMNMTRPICEVHFIKTNDMNNHEIGHIMSRYTNRKAYHPQLVPTPVINEMRSIYHGPSHEILDITGQSALIENFVLLNKIWTMNDSIRDDLVEIFSYSQQEAQTRRWGLDVRVLESPFYVREYLKLNRNKFFRNIISKSLLIQYFASTVFRKSLVTTPLLLAFKESSHSSANLVRDWMYIQKILNYLQLKGLSSHLIVSPIDMANIGKSFLSTQEMKAVSRVHTNFQKQAGIKITELLALLRVGYADECQIKSLRKDPEELFINE
ncbi:MAG: hypothetical protein H6753_03980 [Candidatus Omnitrophica bacterium]|nr:hypothetical protein [Candidatus Omnitrophota bacterium]